MGSAKGKVTKQQIKLQPISHSAIQSNQPISQSANQLFSQSAQQLISQLIMQLVSQPIN
jgi:hypothetical protein